MIRALATLDKQHAAAVNRLLLRHAADAQDVLQRFAARLQRTVDAHTTTGGFVDAAALWARLPEIAERWHAACTDWRAQVEAAQAQAATIPFAVLLHKHNAYFGALQEADAGPDVQPIVHLFQARRAHFLQSARSRMEQDRLNWSSRVWRVEREGLRGIQGVIRSAFSERTSAEKLAKLLEGHLGINEDLRRWTRHRLYGMTPSDRAVSALGLLRRPEMRSRGVAYKALRLARTEIQHANHRVSEEIARHSPWITGMYVRLSPGHPRHDICDAWAGGGPYDPDEQILPLHPNCLCYYTYAHEPWHRFKLRADNWLRGDNEYLDGYADWLGTRELKNFPWIPGWSDALDLWLTGRMEAHSQALLVEPGKAVGKGAPKRGPAPAAAARAADAKPATAPVDDPIRYFADVPREAAPRFRSTDEAIEWLQKTYPNTTFELEGVRLLDVQEIADAWHDNAQLWPEVAAKTKYVGTRQKMESYDWAGSDAIAHAQRGQQYIVGINPRYYVEQARDVGELKRELAQRGWTIGRSARDNIDHEFGHLIDYHLGTHTSRLQYGETLANITSDLGKLRREGLAVELRRELSMRHYPTRALSEYATVNEAERYSEAWVSILRYGGRGVDGTANAYAGTYGRYLAELREAERDGRLRPVDPLVQARRASNKKADVQAAQAIYDELRTRIFER